MSKRPFLLCLISVCGLGALSFEFMLFGQTQVNSKKYALLVAVNRYEDDFLNKPPLKYPEADAIALRSILIQSGYEVESLIGAEATRSAILSKLEAINSKGNASGCVVLGFFGHGVEFESSREAMYIPYDSARRFSKSPDGQQLFSTDGSDTKLTEPDPKSLVSMSEMLNALRLSKAGNNLLLADCCRKNPNAARGTRAFGSSVKLSDLPDNTAAIFACSEGEEAQEDDAWKHGAMTKCFLELLPELSGTSPDLNSITGKLRRNVSDLVSKSTNGRKQQTVHPIMNGVIELQLIAQPSISKAEGTNSDVSNSDFARDASKLMGEKTTDSLPRNSTKSKNDRPSFERDLDYKKGLELYHSGLEPIDEIKALRSFRKAAERGHPVACAYVGQSYLYAWGLSAFDPVAAVEWYRKAFPKLKELAESGDSDSQVALGRALKHGLAIACSEQEAIKWFQLAADAGNTDAMVELGHCYRAGGSIEADTSQMLKLYRMAAQKGNARGTFHLAIAEIDGVGISSDKAGGLARLTTATQMGLPEAFHQLGHKTDDAKKQFEFYKKGYELGDRYGSSCFASLYFDGIGVSKDEEKGLEILMESADANSSIKLEIAKRLEDGNGVQADTEKAESWRKSAFATARRGANAGVPSQERLLSDFYFQGIGTPVDNQEGITWAFKAARNGQLLSGYFSSTGFARADKSELKSILNEFDESAGIEKNNSIDKVRIFTWCCFPEKTNELRTALRSYFKRNANKPEELNDVCWGVFELHESGQKISKSVLLEVRKAAQAAALKASGSIKGYVLDTVAHFLHFEGDLSAAIVAQEEALKFMEDGSSKSELERFLVLLKSERDASKKPVPSAIQPPRPLGPVNEKLSREQVTAAQQNWASYLGRDVAFQNSLGMQFKLIPPGQYNMGSRSDELGRNADELQHKVVISKAFYAGVYEVTLQQFLVYYNADRDLHKTDAEKDGNGGWGYADGALLKKKEFVAWNTGWNKPVEQYMNHPAVNVSWNDAIAFCKWLSRKDGIEHRLLTEAEWEYACRAGTVTAFQNGDPEPNMIQIGNCSDSSLKAMYSKATSISGNDGFPFTAPVGSFQANAFGLFDMHGNVWEWCLDHYDPESYNRRSGLTKDPFEAVGAQVIMRGGSWYYRGLNCRSATRSQSPPNDRGCHTGLRVAISL